MSSDFYMKGKDDNNNYTISISDWINYLESNSHTNINLFILMFTILFSIAITIINFKITGLPDILIYIGLSIFYIVLLVLVFYSSKRAKNYQKLSQRIMIGEITTSKEILEEYEKFKRDIK